ncbi:chemotaxis protein CheB [Streptomyces spinosisporus]|uniref:protein-glutamate methylesterase n=1 Tax=Streptomyces spinosisporus TaxID=2927582 RepID=A0ABS9XHQ7_9ACTN|nr:chemotaxis protein CheB [Streptomyces spinosisporus]MCI3241601.1 chemotaxis protein CheB [Streptomyces spinosisporus]
MQSGQEEDVQDRWSAVLIASSAGGIQGLGTLLGGLEAALPVPILVAQHLNRARETRIVNILSRSTALTVKLAEDGEEPAPGTVYIAPPDRHLCMRADGSLFLTREERVNYARPAADPLFESAAQVYGKGVIGCVLTGSDSDGARGVEAVKAHGGTVIVQDPGTAEFHGMPKAAVGTGQVDFVLALTDIAPAITRLMQSPP